MLGVYNRAGAACAQRIQLRDVRRGPLHAERGTVSVSGLRCMQPMRLCLDQAADSGRYNDQSGQSACFECPFGRFQPETGATVMLGFCTLLECAHRVVWTADLARSTQRLCKPCVNHCHPSVMQPLGWRRDVWPALLEHFLSTVLRPCAQVAHVAPIRTWQASRCADCNSADLT